MRDVLEIVERVAKSDVPILLLGETGTGKSLLARRLHAQSDRAGGPFVTVNCAALPEPLLESELFGHVRGAFTGATRDRLGLVAESSGGTLLLDEIGEMSPMLQAKLLDVLERKVVRAVGASRERPVDLRVISATHRDLGERIAAGAFREDLRYRLEVVAIEVPPLRRRREDIPLLVNRFLQSARAKHVAASAVRLAPEAMAQLLAYRWPGNVRELGHAVERMVLLSPWGGDSRHRPSPKHTRGKDPRRVALHRRGPADSRANATVRGLGARAARRASDADGREARGGYEDARAVVK